MTSLWQSRAQHFLGTDDMKSPGLWLLRVGIDRAIKQLEDRLYAQGQAAGCTARPAFFRTLALLASFRADLCRALWR